MPQTPKVPADPPVDRAALRREAVEHSVRAQQEAARPQIVPRSRMRVVATGIVCGALLSLCTYSWIATPEFIWGPRHAASITPERTEASVRFAMYLVARRAAMYRTREGQYPASGRDITADTTHVYSRVGDSGFRIVARVGGKELALSSADDLATFLGNSAELIQGKVAK